MHKLCWPYKVVKRQSEVNYEVQLPKGAKKLNHTFRLENFDDPHFGVQLGYVNFGNLYLGNLYLGNLYEPQSSIEEKPARFIICNDVW